MGLDGGTFLEMCGRKRVQDSGVWTGMDTVSLEEFRVLRGQLG